MSLNNNSDMRCSGDSIDIEEDSTNVSNHSLFDIIIGHIEDMLVDPSFLATQASVVEKYWEEFDDEDENKLTYMPIFEEYIYCLETFIENRLKETVPDFRMEEFVHELVDRKDELDGEVFEMLYTLSDFKAFKELMLCYKAEKEGRTLDISQDLKVSKCYT